MTSSFSDVYDYLFKSKSILAILDLISENLKFNFFFYYFKLS